MPLAWLILSEGDGDYAFFKNLIEVRKIPNMEPRRRTGKLSGNTVFKQWLEALRPETGADQYSGILIVADNDGNPAKAFKEVRRQIQQAGEYGIPTAPALVAPAQNGRPAVAVLMLPWTDQEGCLETLCLRAALQRRPRIARCIAAYLRCIGIARWTVSNLDKFSMRCLLSAACKRNPNTGLQYAWSAEKGRPKDLIPLRYRCFKQVADFLASLPLI
jgi:hypothetical protein